MTLARRLTAVQVGTALAALGEVPPIAGRLVRARRWDIAGKQEDWLRTDQRLTKGAATYPGPRHDRNPSARRGGPVGAAGRPHRARRTPPSGSVAQRPPDLRRRQARTGCWPISTGRSQTAEARFARRSAAVPSSRIPPELPVSDRVDDLAAAIAANQVVIVAGETGSGKSTQLPKICLQIGRGVRGMIGHTQPRRIAARALAERIAEETGTAVGGAVGYAIRFGDHTGPDTLVKLMTDGILLNEIVRDRMLWAYDTIIIDEAHERSLNIDFLLGYLKELLPRRPDLKLIITSATIDPQRFSRHFGDAPIVEVSGRTYPVEIRYRPYGLDDQADPDDAPEHGRCRRRVDRGAAAARAREEAIDQAQAICDAADELMARRATATSWSSCPASGRSPTPPRCCAGIWRPGAASPRCCRCTGGCPPPISTRSSPRTPAGGSCWPPTSPKPR